MHIHSASRPAFWLILYFFFNLSLTLYNKSVLIKFPYPYTLTALHAFCSTVGSCIAKNRGFFTPADVSPRQSILLVAFSVLYTVNIAVSNLSLQMVTIPFHQVVRSTTPLFTIFLSALILRTRFTFRKMISLIPVVAGVALATYGDYYFTVPGLLLTLLGTVLAALKTICTNLLQVPSPLQQHHKSGLLSPVTAQSHSSNHGGPFSWSGFRLNTKLHPLDLLLRMSPLAFIQCIIYAHLSGELDRARAFSASHMTRANVCGLLVNGMIAFGLNVVSFTANKKTGALTMTVAANVKQVLTILLSVMIFNLTLTAQNAMGISLTLLGGAWYGYIEYREKAQRTSLGLGNGTGKGLGLGGVPSLSWGRYEGDGERYGDKGRDEGQERQLGFGLGVRWIMTSVRGLLKGTEKANGRGHRYAPVPGHGSDEESLSPPPPYSHLNHHHLNPGQQDTWVQ